MIFIEVNAAKGAVICLERESQQRHGLRQQKPEVAVAFRASYKKSLSKDAADEGQKKGQWQKGCVQDRGGKNGDCKSNPCKKTCQHVSAAFVGQKFANGHGQPLTTKRDNYTPPCPLPSVNRYSFTSRGPSLADSKEGPNVAHQRHGRSRHPSACACWTPPTGLDYISPRKYCLLDCSGNFSMAYRSIIRGMIL